MSNYQLTSRGHRGTRAVQRLVEYAPASGGLALWMQHRDVNQAPSRAYWTHTPGYNKPWLIGNDGTTVFYGPSFTTLPIEEQTGHLAHQVLHVALRHVDRQRQLQQSHGSLDTELFSLCADAIVNSALSHLTWLKLPKGSVFLSTLLVRLLGIEEDEEISLNRWDVESLYLAIDDQSQRGSSAKNSDQTQDSSANSAKHESSSQDDPAIGHSSRETVQQLTSAINRDLIPDEKNSPEHRSQQRQQWSERLQRSQVEDDSQSLLRQLIADIQRTQTPWQHVLRSLLQSSLAQQSDFNWSRPNRSWIANQGRTRKGLKLPWQPGNSYARPCPRLCLMVDVSGSVSDPLIKRFANELDRLMRLHRADVYLIIGDDQVRSEHKLAVGCKPLRDIIFSGGGGTDFRPLIKAANAHKPNIGIFLTDLDGPAGDAPGWPIIWAVPPDASVRPAPFGEKLSLR